MPDIFVYGKQCRETVKRQLCMLLQQMRLYVFAKVYIEVFEQGPPEEAVRMKKFLLHYKLFEVYTFSFIKRQMTLKVVYPIVRLCIGFSFSVYTFARKSRSC